MMTNSPRNTYQPPKIEGRHSVGGLMLIGVGIFLLLGQIIDSDILGLFFLPLLGLGFIAWGLSVRQVGLLIPGGILLGIGSGAFLLQVPFANLNGEAQGGVFLLAFAAGWALISLLSRLVDTTFHWWPLIPGGVMAVIGSSLLIGQEASWLLTSLTLVWPVALIVLGVYLLIKGRRPQNPPV
jgi:hypothetical protein